MEKKVLYIFGSSVAQGYGVRIGWAERLTEALKDDLVVENVSECGMNSKEAIRRFPDRLIVVFWF